MTNEMYAMDQRASVLMWLVNITRSAGQRLWMPRSAVALIVALLADRPMDMREGYFAERLNQIGTAFRAGPCLSFGGGDICES